MIERITKKSKMNEVKNFAIGSLGTLGALEMADAQIFSAQDTDPQTLLIRSAITLLAGTLTTVVSNWIKRHKARKAAERTAAKKSHKRNIIKIKNHKINSHGKV